MTMQEFRRPGCDQQMVSRLRDSILTTMSYYGHGVSLAEIIGAAQAAGLDTGGRYALANEKMQALNILIWAGVSAEFYDALADLVDREVIEYHPTSPLVYLMDGIHLDMPLAKGPYRYKEPHWLPVTLSRGPGWAA